jgi:chromosome segregation ATPase
VADEPQDLVLHLLGGIRADMAEARENLRGEVAALRSDMQGAMHSLRADVASDLLTMQARNEAEHKSTREQIVGLRGAVVEYHSAVLGHGALISDLEARVRRLEEKIGLSDA